jgi:beta-glucanase (GH16 family)
MSAGLSHLVVFSLLALVACGPGDAPPVDKPQVEPHTTPVEPLCELKGPPVGTPGDVLIYEENFDGPGYDKSYWVESNGYRGHSTISNLSSSNNVTVDDGALRIVTDRSSDPQYPYVSGYLDMLGRYARTYGKIEFRARFPFAVGVWYAIWGRPWSQPFPELDIEIVSRAKKTLHEVYFVNHWAAPPLPLDERRSYVRVDMDARDFHTYTVLWKPGLLEWQLDGVTKMQARPQGIPELPVYWMINGWVGGWVGTPNDTTPFPNTFEVDYVRIYRVDGVIAAPQIRLFNPKTEYSAKETLRIGLANFDEACAHMKIYDGSRLIRTTSTRPYDFPLAGLTPGRHMFTFVATDGVRETKTTLNATIY